MTLSTYLSCDTVMDEFGSTCGRRTLYSTTDLAQVHRLARQDRWLIDSVGRTLCPVHSGIPAPLGKLTLPGDNDDW